jgi:hypothetical protein
MSIEDIEYQATGRVEKVDVLTFRGWLTYDPEDPDNAPMLLVDGPVSPAPKPAKQMPWLGISRDWEQRMARMDSVRVSIEIRLPRA